MYHFIFIPPLSNTRGNEMPEIIKQWKSSMQKLKPATDLGTLAKLTDLGHGNFHSLNSAQVSSKQSSLFPGDCFVAYRI